LVKVCRSVGILNRSNSDLLDEIKEKGEEIMEGIIELLKDFMPYILLGLSLAVGILLIIVLVLLKSISNIEKRYRKLMRGVNNKNLEELIVGYLDKIDEVKSNSEKIEHLYNNLDKRIKSCIQKTSVVRYRAFDDVGSDLSFSIALLDENNNGVILTGIYGRQESTTYAKPIDKGISRYDLSEEEQQVLKEAMNSI
jgi:RNase H-fold protein (predicted Holliday junction resolvase)